MWICGKPVLPFRRKELEAAYTSLAPDLKAALTLAHQRIETHHRCQVPSNERYADAIGAELGEFPGRRLTPLAFMSPAGRRAIQVPCS